MQLLINAIISAAFIDALLCLVAMSIQIVFDMHPPFTDATKHKTSHNRILGVLIVSGRHLRIEFKLSLDLFKHFVTDNPRNKSGNFNVSLLAMSKCAARIFPVCENFS